MKPSFMLNTGLYDFSYTHGKSSVIEKGDDRDYYTVIQMVLPTSVADIDEGNYHVEYKGDTIQVSLEVIKGSYADPLYRKMKEFPLGTSGAPLESLPYEAFSDNQGKYPAYLFQVTYPYRIAEWLNDDEIDHDEMQVITSGHRREKVLALIVLNKAFTKWKIDDVFSNIKYDHVSNYSEKYYRKNGNLLVLVKYNMLTSNEAYKKSIYKYFLPNIDINEITGMSSAFSRNGNAKIENEEGLVDVVSKAINDVFKHYVESRRWVEPFWDGERKITHEDNVIIIPRKPKNETKIQPTIFVILEIILSKLGVSVTRESDEGIGLLDFKCTFTTNNNMALSVPIEFKVAHHDNLRHGIEQQLPAYLNALKSTHGIFAVMWFKDSKSEYFRKPNCDLDGFSKSLHKKCKEVENKLSIILRPIIIDASIKVSASKM
ncbi:MAG: hypothetical protein RPU64_11350 [Candidatus Sedimenticola sp. (ex Thyasira tokunagai)]